MVPPEITRGLIGRHRGGPHPLRHRWRRRGGVTLPDVRGSISRYMYPTAVADYHSVATASWSSGSIDPSGGGTNYDCYWHEITVDDATVDTASAILPPLRFVIDEPASAGGFHDFIATADLNVGLTKPVKSTILATGSHFTPINWLSSRLAFAVRKPVGSGSWGSPTLQALNPTYSVGTGTYAAYRAAFMAFRLNGSAYSGVLDLRPGEEAYRASTSSSQLFLVTDTIYFDGRNWIWTVNENLSLSNGDTLEVDIWYEIAIDGTALGSPPTGKKKMAVLAIRNRTSNGSRDVSAVAAAAVKNQLFLDGFAVSRGYNPGQHTYSVEFDGGEWLPGDGFSNPQTISTDYGWTASYAGTLVTWTGTINAGKHQGKTATVRLDFANEQAGLQLTLNTSPSVTTYYKPNGGQYIEHVVRRDTGGAVKFDPQGVFTHKGTTVFEYQSPAYSTTPTAVDAKQPDNVTVRFGNAAPADYSEDALITDLVSIDDDDLAVITDALYMGDSDNLYECWGMWRDVTVANAATISRAILVLTPNSVGANGGPGTTKLTYIIKGVADNPPAEPGDYATITSITPTAASVTVDLHGFNNSPAVSPKAAVGVAFVIDVTAIIQEIINDSGWTSGDDLALLFQYWSAEDNLNHVQSASNRLVIYTS